MSPVHSNVDSSVDSAEGLLPSEARAWIDLQRRYAWFPERVNPVLEAAMAMPEGPGARHENSVAHAGEISKRLESVRRPERLTCSLDQEVARLEALGVRVLPRVLPSYPDSLTSLPDAPSVLFVRGAVGSLRARCIAIVGARAATHPARRTARTLARQLAAHGVTIVSGLARGIDAAAHEGAIEAGGATVAVMASGIEEIYPPEHRRLSESIVQSGGAVMTEMPLGVPPRRAHFPLRNRLISGLSAGVIVVEARRRSGSLITVRHALAQGREVFVVPGAVDGPFAEGTNQLLRDGARPILTAKDVLEDLGWGREGGAISDEDSERPRATPSALSAAQRSVLTALSGGPLMRDELFEKVSLAPGALAEAILELGWAGRVVEDRDGRIRWMGS